MLCLWGGCLRMRWEGMLGNRTHCRHAVVVVTLRTWLHQILLTRFALICAMLSSLDAQTVLGNHVQHTQQTWRFTLYTGRNSLTITWLSSVTWGHCDLRGSVYCSVLVVWCLYTKCEAKHKGQKGFFFFKKLICYFYSVRMH